MSEVFQNDSGYFENRDCRYYPCHHAEHINCLFCYCPLYPYADCPGEYTMISKEGGEIKNCTDCMFPHEKENYGAIIRFLAKKNRSGETETKN